MRVAKTVAYTIELSDSEAATLREYLAGTTHDNDAIEDFGADLADALEDEE